MHRRKSLIKRIAGIWLSLSLIVSAVAEVMPRLEVLAASNTGLVTYEYYTASLGKTVPPSWLFVGTYLCSARSLSAEIYQAALDSRTYYEQPVAYYRSELDGGAW